MEGFSMRYEGDDPLIHYGVLGMKWGVRKDGAPQGTEGWTKSVDSDGPSKKKKGDRKTSKKSSSKMSRKEIRADRKKFYQDKADRILEIASKNPENLIGITNPGSRVPTVITGRQFVEHLSKGGMFNVKTTDVWAVKGSDGQYVMNENPNQAYKKPGKR